MDVLTSKSCKNETLHSLKYNYSLPEFLKLKEYIEILDDFQLAINRDEEIKSKSKKR